MASDGPLPRTSIEDPDRRLTGAPWIVVWLLIAILLGWVGPATFSAIELGLDEHFELTKGMLWARGVSLYDPLWNDQPPLLTVFLGLCFKTFGSNVAVARAMALGFGLALLAGAAVVISYRSGYLAAALAVFSLLCAPLVFLLAVSVMLEVPAIGTALWALWPILRWQRAQVASQPGNEPVVESELDSGNAWSYRQACRSSAFCPAPWLWLVLSGAVLAVALQIKLTAAVAAPALTIELLLGRGAGGCMPRLWARLRGMGQWTASLVCCYAGIGALVGQVPPEVLWASHFSEAVRSAAADTPAVPYWLGLWTDYREVLCGAGISLLVLGWQGQWQTLRFPVVWLLTAALVHAAHRPYWCMYNLHFAVPLGWLTGCGIAEQFRLGKVNLAETAVAAHRIGFVSVMGGCVLLAALVTYGGERLWSEATRIRQSSRVRDSVLVAQMRRHAGRTHWVYTRETIYPFHAGLPVLPELAVLPTKRFWSGQITDEQIWTTVMRYWPEQLLLTDADLTSGARQFIESGYNLVYRERALALYVRKDLAPERDSDASRE
ncbi:MAG TPA: hypothetical protein PLY00_17645 [Verrucomicrobiota bacterium]|jgi:hypothetical protein|nr:MAG: hypothetical protein BWX48_00057 [Verrucomicrobia bacterium ADurb.Bin006]HOR73084.1 hypothetical protein [Verrucomicrobiota bacterium]